MRQAGMGLVLAAALVAGTTVGGTGGCASGTKQQQQQARLEKQRQKEAAARAKDEARRLKQQQEQVVRETDVQQHQAEQAAHQEADRRATLLTESREVVPPQPTGFADDRFDVVGNPLIRPENTQRQLDKFSEAMAAAGARNEGMLHDQDFEGAALSPLGRSKLALMLEHATPNRPVTIYVSGRAGATSDEQAQARLAAVQDFWRNSQYANIPLQAKEGVNPAAATPSQAGLNALRNLNKTQDTGKTSTVNINNMGSGSGTGGSGGSGGYGGGGTTGGPSTP